MTVTELQLEVDRIMLINITEQTFPMYGGDKPARPGWPVAAAQAQAPPRRLGGPGPYPAGQPRKSSRVTHLHGIMLINMIE